MLTYWYAIERPGWGAGHPRAFARSPEVHGAFSHAADFRHLGHTNPTKGSTTNKSLPSSPLRAGVGPPTCHNMPSKQTPFSKARTPELATRSEAIEYFNNPLGILAAGMKPSAAWDSLTPKSRAFVLALIESGGGNQTRAARMAGYSGSDASLQSHASRLAADPNVQACLMAVAMGLARSSSLVAITQLVTMIEKVGISDKDRLSAIGKLVSLIGMEPEKHVRHTVEVEPTTKQQVDEIIRMSKEIGIDPRKLLGKAGVVVDAEFEVAGTSAGLEDLLGEDND